MKKWLAFLLAFSPFGLGAQQLQLHYDFRHSIDPELHPRNFPSMTFSYFKGDTTASFLMKLQTDFTGEQLNAGQTFLQVSKSVRYWRPKVFLTLNYSGGLGIAPPSFGYYISNSFGVGVAKNVFWKNTVLSAGLLYRYNAFPRGSHDAQLNIYIFKGFFNYRLQTECSAVAWTQNRDLGIDFTRELRGKKLAFFADPQVWWRLRGQTSIGTRVYLFYQVLLEEKRVQAYPTIGLKQGF